MEQKTNVMRILEANGIEYKSYCYIEKVTDKASLSGVNVAMAMKQEPEKVFKTLVTAGKSKENYVFVIPVEAELDLKKAASAAGEKWVEMIPQKALLPLTGYIHGGCSPIGMKKQLKTFLDETAILYDAIIFSAGKVGYQVEVYYEDLLKLIDAKLCELSI